MKQPTLNCPQCDLEVRNISKLAGRFLRRHPKKCHQHREKLRYTHELAQTYKAVIADKPESEE